MGGTSSCARNSAIREVKSTFAAWDTLLSSEFSAVGFHTTSHHLDHKIYELKGRLVREKAEMDKLRMQNGHLTEHLHVAINNPSFSVPSASPCIC